MVWKTAKKKGERKRFYQVMRRLLNQRWDRVKQGKAPKETDIRHFFYEIRNKTLRENPEMDEIDIEAENKYASYQGNLKNWCEEHAEEFGYSEDPWWRVRNELNIWAEPKAVAYGGGGKFLIDRDTREKVTKGCNFVLVCEKKTVSRELYEKLSDEYNVNVVATTGYSASDLKEVVISIAEELDMDEVTFYFLLLHDYDVDGVRIYFDLKEYFDGIIDVGINQEFLEYFGEEYDPRMLEESTVNKKDAENLKSRIQESDNYNLEDYRYLHGKKKESKAEWIGKRIEIDAIHVEYGIDPFIKYVKNKIGEECKVWDLSKIGVEPFELKEVGGHFEEVEREKVEEIKKKIEKEKERLDKPIEVIDKARDRAKKPLQEKIDEIKKNTGNIKELIKKETESDELASRAKDKLKEKVSELEEECDNYDKDYAEEYEDELEEINEEIKHWEGEDPSKGEEKLEKKVSELIEKAKEDAEEDAELEEFKEKLEKIPEEIEEIQKLKEKDPLEKGKIIQRGLEFLKENNGSEKLIDELEEMLEEVEK